MEDHEAELDGRGDADAVLIEAEAMYQQALDAMADGRRALAAGEVDEAILSQIAAQYRRAALVLFSERKRVAEERGAGGASGVDLDHARREVGRRLDRLRAAAGTKGVSGKP